MPYVSIHIDPDDVLPEFSTIDLQNELSKRKPTPASDDAPSPIERLNELHYALKFGLYERALDIARQHVNEQLGVCL